MEDKILDINYKEDKKLAMQIDFTETSEEDWNKQLKDLKENA